MKAVIVTGGKQYTVAEGDVLYIEKLNAEEESIQAVLAGMMVYLCNLRDEYPDYIEVLEV